jgi:hypothetical protein
MHDRVLREPTRDFCQRPEAKDRADTQRNQNGPRPGRCETFNPSSRATHNDEEPCGNRECRRHDIVIPHHAEDRSQRQQSGKRTLNVSRKYGFPFRSEYEEPGCRQGHNGREQIPSVSSDQTVEQSAGRYEEMDKPGQSTERPLMISSTAREMPEKQDQREKPYRPSCDGPNRRMLKRL